VPRFSDPLSCRRERGKAQLLIRRPSTPPIAQRSLRRQESWEQFPSSAEIGPPAPLHSSNKCSIIEI